MLFLSDQASETYAWLGQSPAMREWIGGRHAKSFSENSITITNLDFEATIEVLVKELRRDKSGQVMIRIAELARRTVSHDAKLISALLENGESTLCYDGQYFFDTDHSEGDSGTQDNDLTAAIVLKTAPTAAEMVTSIFKCINAILAFKDDQGEPINEDANEFLVMVPVAGTFLSSAISAVTDDIIVAGSASRTNTLKNSGFNIQVKANPRLTWTDRYSVFRTDADVKPVIRQLEKDVEIKALAEGSDLEFNEGKHQYGVDKSGNVGYGMWQMACLETFTTA
jgi:phage major head subunit gpT-like protein